MAQRDQERVGDMALTVLVCGGRDYTDRNKVFEVLDRLHIGMRIDTIVHGAASGADYFANLWARRRGVSQQRFPVNKEDWRRLGNAAGPIRNGVMLKVSRPDMVVAFPGGRGTLDMVTKAKAAKVPVMEVLRDGTYVRGLR